MKTLQKFFTSKKLLTSKKLIVLIIIIAAFLRLYKLDQVPVALFGDEVDVGYQAYSILKTGRDYYGNFMPLHFHSLAEYRTPLYLYSAVPSVALFGISALGVRLPAAIFGIASIFVFYLLIKEVFKNQKLALISAAVLALSPWHIQYSRAGFEVTELLFFLALGLYLFFAALRVPRSFSVVGSAICFALLPWIYSTAKLFTPLLLLFLFFAYRKEIFKISKKYLVFAVIAFVIIGGPIAISTITGGGAERFGYISVFTDPTTEPEIGTARGIDAQVRGDSPTGLNPTLIDKVFHNKFTFWGGKVFQNYLHSFSTDFLFITGDPNPRHSIDGMGEFYKLEIIALTVGLILFFSSKSELKIKLLIIFWLLAGVIPAAITRDGGDHATRLILILPPLVFLISYGISRFSRLAICIYLVIGLFGFISYQHTYWIHNPYQSERWWHAGYQEAIQSIKPLEKDFAKVLISTRAEPPWIFFAGFYQYDPASWQKNFPIGNDVELQGIGKVSHIDKFYFGSPEGGVYDWGKVLDKQTLYLASAREINVNLILEPKRTPNDLKLLKAIAYPSGLPAFYIFAVK